MLAGPGLDLSFLARFEDCSSNPKAKDFKPEPGPRKQFLIIVEGFINSNL